MPSSFVKRSIAFTAVAGLAAMAAGPVIAAGPVSVSVNGSPVNLSPAPTTRAGRVFVPLRGVFENLGATVVYSSGTINATGRGHSVQLHIGSTAATVDGQQQTIDVAPFLIGASTYVPLRFVSQALGATVNYDGSNNAVAINTNGNNNPAPSNGVLTPAPGSGSGVGGAITFATVLPARGSTISGRRPLIEATFGGGTVDPNSIRVSLDGADVTNNSTRSPSGFTFAPVSPLQLGQHRVQVSGNDSNGQAFRRGWGFTIAGAAASLSGITNVRPADGATVGNQFVVSGHTSPGAHVTVQVGVASNGGGTTIGQIIGSILTGGQQTNSASASLTANAEGNFSTQVNIGAPAGSTLQLIINATDAQNGATATPVQETLRVG